MKKNQELTSLSDIAMAVELVHSLNRELSDLKDKVAKLEKMSDEPLALTAAAKLLGVTPATLINYRKNGKITPIYNGKKYMYNRSDVLALKAQ